MSFKRHFPMSPEIAQQDTGMELHTLLESAEFRARPKHEHDSMHEVEALRRLAHVFAESPQTILQELVDVAVQTCRADSAGISLEVPTEEKFRWVAIAGSFSQYLHGTTPRFYSPCGTTLDRGCAQHYRVTKPYYDFLGVEARDISDGLLIPWAADDMRGTLWAVSHSSREAFDMEDYRMLQSLADFAAIAVRHQVQQKVLVRQAEIASAHAMAHALAHEINNPLQCVTNTVFLATQGGEEGVNYAMQASHDLNRLSGLVRKLLDLKLGQKPS